MFRKKKDSLVKGIIILVLLIVLIFGVYFGLNELSFVIIENNVVRFEINETWNLSNAFVRISQNETFYDINNVSSLIQENLIVVNLNGYNLTEGNVYVDLNVNGTVVDSAYIYFIPGTSIDIVDTFSEETVEIMSADTNPLWTANSSSTWFVDYVNLSSGDDEITRASDIYCWNGTSSEQLGVKYLFYQNNIILYDFSGDSNRIGGPNIFSSNDLIGGGVLPNKQSHLIAYWSFDEGTGITFKDFFNATNWGNSTSASWTSGRNFYAANITAETNFSVYAPSGLNLTNNFTYVMWARITESNTQTLVSYASNFTIKIAGGNNKVLVDFPLKSDPTISTRLQSNNQLLLNQWNYIAVVYDNNTLSLYINGVLDNYANISGDLNDYYGSLYFGYSPTSPETYLRGQIDEVAIYNQNLTSYDIENQYRNGIVILSKNSKMIIDSTSGNFNLGTYQGTEYNTGRSAIILSNTSGSYNSRGNYTSKIFIIQNGYDNLNFDWKDDQVLTNTNITVSIRTGTRGDNETIRWSDFSGQDYSQLSDSNKVLSLSFSEGVGNTTRDNRLNNNTLNGNDFVPEGKSGYGLQCYRSDTNLKIDNFNQIRLTTPNNYSIELWVNPIQYNSGILKKNKYYMGINTSGNVIYTMVCDSATYNISSTTMIPLNNWTHILVSHSSDNITKMYVNGILENTQTIHDGLVTSTTDLTLCDAIGYNSFNGTIDNFVIYNKTLSNNEAYLHSRNYFYNSSGDLISAYKLNNYIQYRATLSTNDNTKTPELVKVGLNPSGLRTYVYNQVPSTVNILNPGNQETKTSASFNFEWADSTDLENDRKFYEFVIDQNSSYNHPSMSKMLLNNFSEVDYNDDNYFLLIEHFNNKDDLIGHNWEGNYTSILNYGKWGNGISITQRGENLKNNRNDLIYLNRGTIEFWVKPNWNPNDTQSNYFLDHQYGIISMNRTGSQINLQMGSYETLNYSVLTYNISQWSAGNWYHIAINWPNSGNFSLYINGMRVNSTGIPNIESAAGNFYLGSNSSNIGENLVFNGTIDEFATSSLSRVPLADISQTDVHTNLSNRAYLFVSNRFGDGTYYWKVRSFQARNKTLENQSLYSTWQERVVVVETAAPNISVNQNTIQIFNDRIVNINFSTGEKTNCTYRNSTSGGVLINTQNYTNFYQNVTTNSIGSYTYYLNCSDANDNHVNSTISFFVFNYSIGVVKQNTTVYMDFTANTQNNLTFTDNNGINYTRINFTTRNNIGGRAASIRHQWNRNPTNTSVGLPTYPVAYWTLHVEEQLINNLTGNISVTFYYNSSDISSLTTVDNFNVYYFNSGTSTWSSISESFSKTNYEFTINTSSTGVYVIGGETVDTEAVTPSPTSGGSNRLRSALPPRRTLPIRATLEIIEEFEKGCCVDEYGCYYTTSEQCGTRTYDDEGFGFYYQERCPDIADYLSDNEIYAGDFCQCDFVGDICENNNIFELDSCGNSKYFVQECISPEEICSEDSGEALCVSNITESPIQETSEIIEFKPIDKIQKTIDKIKQIFEAPQISIPNWLTYTIYLVFIIVGMFFGSRALLSYLILKRKKEKLDVEDLQEENMDKLKYYIYRNIDRLNMDQELLQKGWSPDEVMRLIKSIRKLERDKLGMYVYSRLAEGDNEEAIVKVLVEKGWSENKVRKDIEKFKEI